MHHSQHPEPQCERALSDDDDFLRDFSPIADREQSVVRETVPLTIRTSPARPKPNKFTNIAREIVGNREVIPTVEEEEEQEERPEVNSFSAAYVGKEMTPCYSKIIDNIWEFRLTERTKDLEESIQRAKSGGSHTSRLLQPSKVSETI